MGGRGSGRHRERDAVEDLPELRVAHLIQSCRRCEPGRLNVRGLTLLQPWASAVLGGASAKTAALARIRGRVIDMIASAISTPVPPIPNWSATVKRTPSGVWGSAMAHAINAAPTTIATIVAIRAAFTGRAVTSVGFSVGVSVTADMREYRSRGSPGHQSPRVRP